MTNKEFYSFSAKNIKGQNVDMSTFKDKIVLVCSATLVVIGEQEKIPTFCCVLFR